MILRGESVSSVKMTNGVSMIVSLEVLVDAMVFRRRSTAAEIHVPHGATVNVGCYLVSPDWVVRPPGCFFSWELSLENLSLTPMLWVMVTSGIFGLLPLTLMVSKFLRAPR